MRSNVFAAILVLAVLVLMAAQSAFAYQIREFSGEYDLSGDAATVTMDFQMADSTALEIRIPWDATQLFSSGNYTLITQGDHKILRFAGQQMIEVSYLTSSLIERTGDRFFILDLSRIDAEKMYVLVKLPESATLKYPLDSNQPSMIPKTKDVATDGKRILIRWTEKDFSSSKAGLVIYELQSDNSWALPAIISIVLFALLTMLIYLGLSHLRYLRTQKRTASHPAANKKRNKRNKTGTSAAGAARKKADAKDAAKGMTRNLFEDEKLIVEALLAEKTHELWQKQLAIKTGLSKVKLSRKLRGLEQKGLIERVPYGNTNKVRLLK
jgi:uncharacterized membrane protein